MSPGINNQGYSGQRGLTDDKSPFNAISFVIEQMLGQVRTILPVKVIAVAGGGADVPAGTVDVQPLIKQIDGVGNTTPHGTVLNLPVWRIQGGGGAVILDPQVGDIGLAAVCDRDISSFKETSAEAAPGSFRRFSLPDAIYFGGILNSAPTKYVALTDEGITLNDGNGNVIEMKAGSIAITTLSLTINGTVFAGFGTGDQVGLQTHTHISAPSGSPTSPPTPGT